MEVIGKDAHNVAFASYSETIVLAIPFGSPARDAIHLVIYGQNRFRPTAR